MCDTRTKDMLKRQLELAGAQGSAVAQSRLGSMHYDGHSGNPAEARRLYGRIVHATDLIVHRQGGPQDFAEARRLLRLAAAYGLSEQARETLVYKLDRAISLARRVRECRASLTRVARVPDRRGRGDWNPRNCVPAEGWSVHS